MRILEAERVTKHFGGLAAVANVNFHVDQNEIVGLIGPNGAGKTTLFNLISGLLFPTSGVIRFKGETITGLGSHLICRRGIARTFQQGKLFTDMTVLENVLLGAFFGTSKRVSKSDAERESRKLLEFLQLSDKENHLAKDLTIAAQKRLEIARALATKPALLLFDEVMAGLTQSEIAASVHLVREIRDEGITVFMIEHVMRAIMDLADRIMVLHQGEKIAEGMPGDIAENEAVVKVYLGN
jgi:branched-chain amino acid transport system ATP-binding protein